MEDYQVQRPAPVAGSTRSGKLGPGGGGQARRAASLNYGEIFGAASACSIPVLDLPPAEDGLDFRHCSAMDYLDIFGFQRYGSAGTIGA
ncbi:unnamed protein product [Spirodela intermedia]|uniref:Uncharacterized protein n=2 Tax=Spirodela intermedia TaxID=51605 RepID=A0A7I8KIY8_SPIIN|nr:unnamed protein product [Spirodela intermedia]CAA6661376.1 unnamed protein product [Spirodela intermedia]CAA7397737.1 unnamed protein product [Spirodela intermedia]